MRTNILLLGIFVITLSSCQDFLEVSPETVITTSNFYKSQQDFEQAVTGIYAPLRDIYQQDWILTEMRSDNTHFIFDVANRGSKPEEDPATFTIENNNRNIQDKWSDNYLIISRANEVITNFEEIDFSLDSGVEQNLKGQAYFLRALAYFDLVKNFGGVPLFLKPAESYEGTFLPRAPLVDVYDQIISDATMASNLLPNKGSQDSGRATAGAAYVLLADAYITLEKWQEAESSLLRVTTMGYNLLPDYEDIFRPSNWNNDEIIFQVEYLSGTSRSLGSQFPYRFLPVLSDPSILTGVSPANQNDDGSFNTPTPDILEAYENPNIDKRYAASIGFYTGESPLIGVTYNNTPYIKKYQHPHSLYNQTDQNWPVYRYAEVLLMLAESINEQGRSSDALVYLNEVRERAELDDITTTVQSSLRELIFNERRIELAFENKRWHDLVRRGLAETIMNVHGEKVKNNPQDYYYPEGSQPFPNSYNISVNDYLYPIPINETTLNKELEQNPGY